MTSLDLSVPVLLAGALFAAQLTFLFLLRQIRSRIELSTRIRRSHSTDVQTRAILDAQRRALRSRSVFGRLVTSVERLLAQAGIRMSGLNCLIIVAAAALLFFLLIRLVVPNTAASLSLGIAFSVSSGFAYVIVRREQRLTQISAQIPDALETIVRSLKAGHPVSVAVAMISKQMPDPIRSEFEIVSEELALGSTLSRTLTSLHDRLLLDDLQFLGVCVSIQSQTGGNLVEVLERTSVMIRQRFRLRRKIKALSSEGRFSAKVMAAFPLLLFFGMNAVYPDYYSGLSESPLLVPGLIGCAVLFVVGNLIIFRMINFKY